MIRKILIGLGAALLAAGLVILGRDGRALRRTEENRDRLLATKIKSDQDKAEKLNKKAERHKAGAAAAAEATRARLEARDASDNDMGDLLSAFESERVRQRSSG